MAKERILITVKTYPTLSSKYGETVCTAGIREDGTWVRIYPVPFRRLEEKEQYRKFDWIECDLRKATSDPRPESHHPVDVMQLEPVGHIDSKLRWSERRRAVLGKVKIHTSLTTLISEAKSNKASLALFKPTTLRKFIIEKDEREWSQERLEEMRQRSNQQELFAEEWRKTFRIVQKLPYSFSYEFSDAEGKVSTLQILDWEIGALYWNCLRSCNNNEEEALIKVRAKYEAEFKEKDLHFFLGTTQQYHFFALNPWVIIGVFPIPHEMQRQLL